LGRKHIYLPHAQTAIYDSKGKVIFKTGNIPSTWSYDHSFFMKNIPQANRTCGFDHR
jgi:hypothetical protein